MFETSQGASRGRTEGNSREEDSWDIRLQVLEARRSVESTDGGATFVQVVAGTTQNPLGKWWILIGGPKKAHGREEEGTSVSDGVVIGIRKPTWEIQLSDDEIWSVGVEWTVLTR